MKEQSVFHLISEITHKKDVPCIVIGGFAINHHNYSRNTRDFDLLITKEDFDKISEMLEKAGYKKNLSENFANMTSSKMSLMNIDFMFVDRETLTGFLKEGQELKIAGQKFIVPSLNHLIALKLHSIKHNQKLRLMKDLPDILNLVRINKVNIRNPGFKALCLKYGNQELYERIKEFSQ